MSNKEVIILNHPLIHHKLAKLRDKNTCTKEFRETVGEIAGLMAYEATREIPTMKKEIITPVGVANCSVLSHEIVIVPILRAGLGMVEAIQNLIPTAKIGHIGLYRDEETLEPHEYYAKFPPTLPNAIVLLVDPMLATGHSAAAAIDILKKAGAKHIVYLGIVGVQTGIDTITSQHPDVKVVLATQDERLNEKGYIVPGLGDCGDRLFGTK